MTITKIEKIDKKKIKIFLDEEFWCILYPQDIRIYQLQEGLNLPDELYHKIMEETVYRRAKQKAAAILERMDRTEYELRNKLKKDFYSEEVIEKIISEMYSYHYIDDERYASLYVEGRQDKKSRRQIVQDLYRKGIRDNIISDAIDKYYAAEKPAILKAIQKKTNDVRLLTEQEKQKLAASLYRKGFQYDEIRQNIWK